MRFGFRQLPGPGPSSVRPRPIIDVVVEGLDFAPQACLLDSGATAIRFGTYVAEVCGVDLSAAPKELLAVGGARVEASMAEESLLITDGEDSHAWNAPVWFCEPWTPAFGLLGLTGFFDQCEITIASNEERIELIPTAR